MLYAVPPELARALTPSKADRSLCKHRVKDGLPSCPAGEAAGQGPGRSAAASLAQAPSSSLLTASSDRDGKEMGPLLLSLNKCSRTCNLLVSAWARGPHRNSWRAGSLSATCRYSRTMTPRSITRRPFLGMLRSSPCIPSQGLGTGRVGRGDGGGGGGGGGRGGPGGCGPLLLSLQLLHIHQALGVSWVLKVFHSLAELTHLNQGHNDRCWQLTGVWAGVTGGDPVALWEDKLIDLPRVSRAERGFLWCPIFVVGVRVPSPFPRALTLTPGRTRDSSLCCQGVVPSDDLTRPLTPRSSPP
nr:uncharacterized protein LOC105106552 isoform X1 [Camelus dromedarius]